MSGAAGALSGMPRTQLRQRRGAAEQLVKPPAGLLQLDGRIAEQRLARQARISI
jgi:hypothetical protein